MSELTKNDLRVLRAVAWACERWDGFAPHGSSDWLAIKRLEAAALVERSNEYGECQTCEDGRHETALYTLTVYGDRKLHPVSETLSGGTP